MAENRRRTYWLSKVLHRSTSVAIVALSAMHVLISPIAGLNQNSYENYEVQEFCHMETFQPRCHHGDVIVMRSALFGRMRVGRCVPADEYQSQQQHNPSFLGCSVDVLDHLHQLCSGKSACDVNVASPELYKLKPCSAHLAMYLEVSYSCISVAEEDRSCSIVADVGPQLHISSSSRPQSITDDVTPKCGSLSNPWIVQAQTGQQINISLLDFSRQPNQIKISRADDVKSQTSAIDVLNQKGECNVYGYILDKTATGRWDRNTTICGIDAANQREFLFQSKGSAVEIVIQPSFNLSYKFLLGIEAIGCSNLVPPMDAWLRRTDNEVTVGCFTTRQRWHLHCQNGKWRGIIGKCHDNDDNALKEQTSHELMVSAVRHNESFLHVLVIIGLTFVGIAICLLIIFVGFGCCRRYQQLMNLTKNDTSATEFVSRLKDGNFQTRTSPMCLPATTSGDAETGDFNRLKFSRSVAPADGERQYFILDSELVNCDNANF